MARLSPLDVPIPRPVRDVLAGANRLLILVLGVLLLVVAGITTGGRLRLAEAFLHEGIETRARVDDIRWMGGRSRSAWVRFVYPTSGRSMVVTEERRWFELPELESAGSIPVWYLPHEPAQHTFEAPTQRDVDEATWLRLLAMGGVGVFTALLWVGRRWVSREEQRDLRYGEALRGRVVRSGSTVHYVYGPDERAGKFSLGSSNFVSEWPVGREITVLQRPGHRPRVWEKLESVEIDPASLGGSTSPVEGVVHRPKRRAEEGEVTDGVLLGATTGPVNPLRDSPGTERTGCGPRDSRSGGS